jgi:hypothetical protein
VLGSIESRMKSAVKTLYPEVTDDNRLPATLPIERYAGTYYNSGYQNITLTLTQRDGHIETTGPSGERTLRLRAEQPDHTWPRSILFEHVSGEFWVAYVKLLTGPGTKLLWEYASVQFKLAPNGMASQIGIEWRDMMTGIVDGVIWYDRVA